MTLRVIPAPPRPRFVRERKATAVILLLAGPAVLATVFAALPPLVLAGLVATWCAAVVWFALTGTSTSGFTALASLVKLATLALIVLAVVDHSSPVGIRTGLYWIPLGVLNMGTGLWFLSVIRRRAR